MELILIIALLYDAVLLKEHRSTPGLFKFIHVLSIKPYILKSHYCYIELENLDPDLDF